jgi:Tol biopolymer transport system component
LLSHAANDYNASFSADGRWVVFTSERDGSADLYRVHPDGTGLERLTDYIGFDDQGALSPDARVLAFVSTRGGQADIWMLDLATRGVHNLTNHPAGDFRPAWSPDGEWLAFSSDRSSTRPRYQFTVVQSTEIYVVRRDGTGLRRLTNSGAYLGSPSWSSDGRSLLVYKAEVSEVAKITTPRRLRGTTQIATIDVATGEERALSSGPGEKWSPRFLPDRRVAYVSGGPEGGLEFTSGAAGARGEFASPSWSPDGRRMIFHRDVGDDWPPHRAAYSLDPRYRLVRTGVFASYAPSGDRLVLNDGTAGIVHNRVLVMDADGTHRTVLFSDSVKSALAPAWSPQGDRIAFAFGRFFPAVLGSSAAAIAVTPVDRPDPTLLTDPGENAGFPSWSPDGRRLVYRVARESRSALMIVDIGTRAVRQLTDWSSNDNSPSWSPCGDRIVFTSNRDPSGDYDLYTIRPDGTDLRRLTSSPGNDSHPAWSPDCEWIAFTSARGGFKDESALHPANPQPYGDINVVRPDGSDVRRLTDDQFEDGTPTWIPNTSRAEKEKPGK